MGLFSHCKDVCKQKDYWKSDVCCHHSGGEWEAGHPFVLVVSQGRMNPGEGMGHMSSLQMGVRTGIRRLL